MKCGYCNKKIATNGEPLPTVKVEKVSLEGEGRWTEQRFAVTCPSCDAILGFVKEKVNG